MSATTVLERLRARAVSVEVVAGGDSHVPESYRAGAKLFAALRKSRDEAEREAISALAALRRGWQARLSRAERLGILADIGVSAGDIREMREADLKRAADRLSREGVDRAITGMLAEEPFQTKAERLKRALARSAVNAALDKAMGGTGDQRNPWSQTPTVVGMPRPVLEEDPFPLNRIKRLPLPPKRAVVRPGWLDLVRAVQRAHKRRCSRRHSERVSDQGRARGVVTSPGHE